MYNEQKFVNPARINDMLKGLAENKEPLKPATKEELERIANEMYLHNEDVAYKRACKGRDKVLFDVVAKSKECNEWLGKFGFPNKFKKYVTIVPYIYGGSLLSCEYEDLLGYHERLDKVAKTCKSSKDRKSVV